MKTKAKKFRIRRGDTLANEAAQQTSTPEATPAADATAKAPPVAATQSVDIDSIRREGLTGRQLRMARRVAQKNGLAVTSDFDAVRQLRANGIDPFQRNTILELVAPEGGGTTAAGAAQQPQQNDPRAQLPQTVKQAQQLPTTERAKPTDKRSSEIMRIQRDIAKRRRRRLALLATRVSVFVMIPTFIVAWYFMTVATPMYATNAEFVIQQAESGGGGGAGGLGGLLQGTSMATQQDSITVQSYLASREAMVRLDEDHGFKAHFGDPEIDQIQRLAEDASNEDAFKLYKKHVKISYDPTEGILRMEVIAANPETSQLFSEALIKYAEDQVDQMTQRPRDAAMAGALNNYEEAENRRTEALAELLRIQEDLAIVGGEAQTQLILQQIQQRQLERQQLELSLAERLGVSNPNQVQVDQLRSRIANLNDLIAELNAQLTESTATTGSLASRNTQVRLAEENYAFQSLQVQAALTNMEAARIEANKQVRYVSVGVSPIAPDEATYPRAFENTLLAFLIFAGVYLMISLTASILREQVVS